MSYLENDTMPPVIQIDSVAIGLQLNDDFEAKNLNRLDLRRKEEFLVVGEKTYHLNDINDLNDLNNTSNTKWSFIVNDNGVAINTSRRLADTYLTTDTSLYVDKNIHCSGIIKAAGLQISNIIIDDANPITCNLVKEFIDKTNQLLGTQPFKISSLDSYFENIYNHNYKVTNIYTPSYVTFGGEVDTYNNTHPLNIVTTPNNKFGNMHISIRNDTNNDDGEPVKMCMGIIGGFKNSPAIISTSKGVPLEFHVSKSSIDIESPYGNNAVPTYSNISNIPAMTIDANNNVGIGTNVASKYIYQKRTLYNNKISADYYEKDARLDIKGGIAAFEDILIKDYETGLYKHTDDIYIRNSGLGALNATQINGGDFTDEQYNFNNNLSVNNLLNAKNAIIQSNIEIKNNTKTDSLNVENTAVFNGNVVFNKSIDFTNTDVLNINNLNVNLDIQNDIFINNKKIVPLDLTDPYTGYTNVINKNGSNFIFMYISSNIAYLDANSNVSFPNKMGLGLKPSDKFEAILNITNDGKISSNTFDILLKNTVDDKQYIANIGRLSRLDNMDNSLIINTNKVAGKKNNIYFYPETDVKSLTTNYYSCNIANTYPTLAIAKNSIGINKLKPDSMMALDVNGNVSASEYYVNSGNNYSKTKAFVYNRDKDFFNIYDKACDKFCINYKESREEAHNMRGLNVKKGINADFYYQNNILLENLRRASDDSSFYTNKNISIGWKGEDNVAPLQVRNILTNDYNYSTIRIYRGVTGGGKYNNADYSGIDICEYERDLNSDRNKEKWFIYKNHKYNDIDSRDVKRVGPLQIGYTNKTIEPTSYGMSFYYDTVKSKYHIDVNNPKVSYKDDSAMTIYGDLSVHGNINILDNYGCNFNFNFKGVTAQLEKVDKYVDKYFNYISCNILNNAYNNSLNKIITSFDIFRPKDNIIIDCINNIEIPLIVKNVNNVNNDNGDETEEWKPAAKFITYSKKDVSYSSIELSIYNSNFYRINDADDIAGDNIRSSVEISTCLKDNNTILDFNVLNSGSHKNFLRFVNNTDGTGDIINTVAHLGIGESVNSNILLHIDGNAKYGMQITNKSYPATINLVNSEGGKDVYHSISGGDVNNKNIFTIDVAAKSYSEYNPDLVTVFSIDAFDNYKLRKGARFGFNDTDIYLSEENKVNKATVVINSEYDNSATAITNRYTYDFIYESSVNIAYSNIYFASTSNWNNDFKIYNSSTKQSISTLPNIDENGIEINPTNSVRDDFVISKNNILTKRLFYTTIHDNIEYVNNYSNLEITCASYDYGLVANIEAYGSIYTNTHSNNLFNIAPRKIIDIYNDLIIDEGSLETTEINITTGISHDLSGRNLEFNYSYYNQYRKSLNIDYDIAITSLLTHDVISDSNYINVSNSILTKLLPFDENSLVIDKIYTELNEARIDIDNDIENSIYIEYSNLYLRTLTTNIVRYNSNINYSEKYYAIHSNYLDINASNIFIEKLFNTDASLFVSSNIIGNNVFIKTSNYTINPLVDSLEPYDTELKLINSNVYIDSFNILGYTCNNTLVIEEYVNDYSNINLENFIIGIRNYNKTKYHPHISLINTVENSYNISCNIHEIYSYDGTFEINYIDDDNNDFSALKIDKNRNLIIGGGIRSEGNVEIKNDLIISGNIYDIYGNNLLNIYTSNGIPLSQEFKLTQGMIVQTVHKTYRDTKAKEDNTTSWVPIDIDNLETGFVIKIKPSHASSKVIISMSCHIGMDYSENSRWWGIQLYRKIGDGEWLPVENANGSNDEWLEGSPCWISHNMGADSSLYSQSIINVSGSYEDSPETVEDVYYTAYWKSKLNNSFGRLYINRPATISNGSTSNYPLTSSSWTASEIWNNGLSYVPMDSVVSIAYNKVGIGTVPAQNSEYKLDVNGTLNASNYFINGKPLSQISNDFKLTQGMIVQMIHKTYRDTKAKEDNTTSWVPIDIDDLETGFVIKIKPTHITSKVVVSMSCHIGMDYAENSRWWGIKLYRKIGDGEWLPVENANGSNDDWLEGSPCWVSHNMGADSSLYSHSIINVYGSYEDSPSTTNFVYYTAYWKSKLNNSFGRLYINRPATITGAYTSNYPLTSSSWSVTEIWNNGEPYEPIDTGDNTIIIANNNVGIGTVPQQNSEYKLDVYGALNASNYFINGKPLSRDFKLIQGMIVQTVHKTYRDTKVKDDNTTAWVAIDNNLTDGFVIKIKPSHITSKVLLTMSCHIGMDYAENSRWWGIQLFRKIGNGEWLPVENANGSNDDWLEGSPCWISHNMGADSSLYSHSIINVSGSYEDSPSTTNFVYYTAYWKSKLNNTFGRLYINRPATISGSSGGSSAYTSNYPLTSSSWTASEIWNNGEPYEPVDTGDNTIIIANNNVGIGTVPVQNSDYKLDIYGALNASNYFINGKPLTQDFKLTQGMIVQTVHKTYRDTKAKEDNTTAWVAIDNNLVAGFVIKIKPSHATSKILISMSCHIGMDYADNSRWWGIQLFRKIGNGEWLPVENANGSNDDWLEGSPCWISHNMGADSSLYSHSIINVSGSYEDSPATIENVYYTAYWKSKLNNSFGRLYINRPATISSGNDVYTSNYPLTSSSWTASEIWNNGESYVPVNNGDDTISIAYNKVGIGTVPLQNSAYKLDVVGDIRANNIGQTSDYRIKKNIESINNVLESVNSLRPVSYLTLDQQSTDKKSYGFIAQELNEIFPNIVNEPNDGNDFYSIKYISMIPLLVKSIQELNSTIELMRKEIDTLKQN